MPTGNDYLAIRYISAGTFDFLGDGAGQNTDCSASFSGSAASFHAISSSQGTYTWDSDTGAITVNSDGNLYIHGTMVLEKDGNDTRPGRAVGYMGISSSMQVLGNLSTGGYPYPSAGEVNKLGAKRVSAISLIVPSGPSIGGSSRGTSTPRSHAYQMFLTGVVAGTVIKPTFRNIGNEGTPFKDDVGSARNVRLREGTSIIIQNFPDNTINQAYTFTHVNYTGSGNGAPRLERLANQIEPHWITNHDFGSGTGSVARSASFGFNAGLIGSGLNSTGSFSASSDLQSANLTDQKYIITSMQGIGGSNSTPSNVQDQDTGLNGGSGARWAFFPSTDTAYDLQTIYAGKIGYTIDDMTGSYIGARRGITGFAANMGNSAVHAVSVPHLQYGGDPVYAMIGVNPILAGGSQDRDSAAYDNSSGVREVVNDKYSFGQILTGSSFAIIPMAPYSTAAKADSYFSVNLTTRQPKSAASMTSLATHGEGLVRFTDSGHVNMWVGTNEVPDPAFLQSGSFFGLSSLLLPGGAASQFTSSNNITDSFNSIQMPAQILTSSGITPNFTEGKITVNHDGMYVLKQTWNSVALSSSTGNERDVELRVIKNATSGTLNPSGNYLAGGTEIYNQIFQLDDFVSNGYTSVSTVLAFTASADDYFTCDLSCSTGPGAYSMINAGTISLTMYRIGEIPGFVPAPTGPFSGSGLDLFNRDLSVINRYSVTNQYTTSYASASHQVPYILGSRGITTLRDRDEPPAPVIGKREIIRKKRR
jgi:hypothetical protein